MICPDYRFYALTQEVRTGEADTGGNGSEADE
jgi:hypothetical protein